MSFFDDLKIIKSLSDDEFSKYIEYSNTRELNSTEDYVLFEKFLKESSLKDDKVKALNRIVGFLADFVINEKTVKAGLEEFEKEFQSFFLSDDDANLSWIRIKESIENNRLENFIVRRKEQRLKNQVPHLHQFSLVCDTRPVFDIERKKVIKYLFPVLLKIMNHDNEISLYELDEDDLIRIKKEVDTAINKLNILKGNDNVQT